MNSSGERQHLDFDLNHEDGFDLLAGEQHCPLCGCEYEGSHLVREHAGLLTLAVQCHCCGTGSLVTVTRDEPLAKPTRSLTSVEQAFFASLRSLSDDDVERMRAIIRSHDGDLHALIQK